MEIIQMFVPSCFPGAAVILSAVAKSNSQLLITPVDVFSRSWGYAQHLVVGNFSFLECFLPAYNCRQASFHSLFSLCWETGSSYCDNSIKKGENLARQTSSKYSMIMNLTWPLNFQAKYSSTTRIPSSIMGHHLCPTGSLVRRILLLCRFYLPTPPLGQDMAQGQIFKWSLLSHKNRKTRFVCLISLNQINFFKF